MRDLLPLLPRPSRYAGIEDGTVRKDPDAVCLRVALAFPDLYEVGMSYLGQKILYGIVNAHDAWWAERVMAPDRAAADILRKHGAPLCTLESDTPLGCMDCVAFSITHELCYTNVLYMLDLAGIPLRHAARGEDLAACPLVIAGGGAVLGAEPLAPFMDLMVLGDGEETLPDLLRLLEQARAEGWTRSGLLREARHIPGVYVPSFFAEGADGALVPRFADHARPARRIVTDLERALYPARQVIPVGAVHNRLSLEIARGCTRGCRFCHAGMVYRPVRERSPESVSALLEGCLRETGFEEISFLSLSTGDYSALKTLCAATLDRCAREQVALSLPSLRVGSIDDEIMGRMADLRRTGCTLAPEAGSQRLRDVINKNVTEEDLERAARNAFENGWQRMKLYFMMGLPTETDDDIRAIPRLAERVLAIGREIVPKGRRGSLSVSVSVAVFVPKAHTPFQWCGQLPIEEVRRRQALLLETVSDRAVRVSYHDADTSMLEAALSKMGREGFDLIYGAWRRGCRFDAWTDRFRFDGWCDAAGELDIDLAVTATEELPLDARLPWDHASPGVSKGFLKREWRRALQGKTTGDCTRESCTGCGICPTLGVENVLAGER